MEERKSRRIPILNRLRSFIKKERAKTIGIALGGGVVWGTAHIGVLEAIAQEGITIDAVAGSSAGSIVAALFAFGISLERIKARAEKLRMSDILKLRVPRMGLASTEGIGALVREFLGDAKIEDAPIPLYIPATDLTTAAPHLFEHVSVADAVMASSAIPGIFVPMKIDGHTYVDGSLLTDVPCQILKIRGIDFVIGVELVNKEQLKKEPTNIFDVITKSIQVIVNETRMERLRFADVIIAPDVHDIGPFDFERVPLLIHRGKEAVSKHIELIRSRTPAR